MAAPSLRKNSRPGEHKVTTAKKRSEIRPLGTVGVPPARGFGTRPWPISWTAVGNYARKERSDPEKHNDVFHPPACRLFRRDRPQYRGALCRDDPR